MAHPFVCAKPMVPSFNGGIHIVPSDAPLTSDVAAILIREVMDRLGITHGIAPGIIDQRDPLRITHPMVDMIRTAVCLYAQGWTHLDDADTLRHDPALCLAASVDRGCLPLEPDGGLPSQPTLSRLVEALADPGQMAALRRIILDGVIQRVLLTSGGKRLPLLPIDVDSAPIEVHGRQPGSECNGHDHVRMCHPLIATSAQLGDVLDAMLRRGAAAAADGAQDFILPLVRRLKATVAEQLLVRMDAGFPSEPLFADLEAQGVFYIARIKSNAALDRLAKPHVGRAPGRPPSTPRIWFHELTYQAGTWSQPRRVVLVVKERLGELINDRFFLVTNMPIKMRDGRALLDEYRERGTAEGHIGELKDVLAPALSAASRSRRHRGSAASKPDQAEDETAFARNAALLLLNTLAYNIMHAGRVLVEHATKSGLSLRRFRQTVLKVAGRIIRTGRSIRFHVEHRFLEPYRAIITGLGILSPAPS